MNNPGEALRFAGRMHSLPSWQQEERGLPIALIEAVEVSSIKAGRLGRDEH